MDKTQAEENTTNTSGAPKPKLTFKENKGLFIKTKFIGFLKMIYNPQKKQFLNKDGQDWMRLGLFYVVFYAAIGFYTWAIMAIFMAITKGTYPDKPKYTGTANVLYSAVYSPGLAVKPHYGTDAASISYSVGDAAKYVDFLNQYLQPHLTSVKHGVQCNSSMTQAPANAACIWDIDSYLTSIGCNSTDNYGYSSGAPCVLIKLNNIFDWKPTGVKFPPNSTFASVNGCSSVYTTISANKTPYIYITCGGVGDQDKNNIITMLYSSPLGVNSCVAGIPFYFYPYENTPYYMQPLIPLRLNVVKGTTVNLQCYAWANGITQDTKLGYGYTKFSVSVS